MDCRKSVIGNEDKEPLIEEVQDKFSEELSNIYDGFPSEVTYTNVIFTGWH